MEPDPKDNKNDEDSSTKYILEYYKKYSQNKKLPKYFSGTSIAYLPEIADEEKSNKNANINVVITTEDEQKTLQIADELELSPTGSIGSNKKLEWDNLADIGYYNATLIHRSSSLPVISQLSSNYESTGSKHLKSVGGDGSNVKVIIYPYSSSSEDKSNDAHINYTSSSYSPPSKKDPTPTSTTLSSAAQKHFTTSDSSCEEKVSSFKQTLDYLKTKIGLPDAHSTPYEAELKLNSIERLSNTPFIPKREKPVKNLNEPKIIDPPSLKRLETMEHCTKKLTTEEQSSNLAKKVVNLCLTKPLLVDCVSKTITTKQLTIGIQTEASTQIKDKSQKIITKDTEKTNTDTGKSSSSNCIASNCDSFEYIENKGKDNSNEPINKDNNQVPQSSKNSGDIEKNIYVLQKLLKSKKYDPATKKKYTKKILQKIIESRYLEDSSTSSELFYPKTDPSKVLKDQIKHSFFKNEESSSSYQSHEDQKTSPSKRKTEFTKKQIMPKDSSKATLSKDVQSKSSSLSSPRKNKIQTGTVSTKELFNIENNEQEDFKETKKGPFTLTTKISEHCGDKISPTENYLSSSTPKSYENWKKLETNSELIFENSKSVGDGDHLIINFADKERQYQLNWIDREINHLGKLKSLLEKPKNLFEIGENIKKTTSVYMVSGSNSVPRRNYVIETNLGVKGTQPRNFCLNGQNYVVCDPRIQDQESGLNKKSRPVIADIEVHSDEKTTNIKVNTVCSVCHNVPCLCDSVANLTKREITSPCDEEPCCSTRPSSKYSDKRTLRPARSPCGICQKTPCICSNDNGEAKSSKYSDCQCSPRACDCESKTSKVPTECNSIPVKGYIACPNGTEEETEVCLCDLALSDNTTSSSKENQSGSIGKIFKNCKCDKQRECNCDFVSKLLKCFSTQENSKSKKVQNSEALPFKESDIQYSDKNVGTENSQNINTINIIIDNKDNLDEQIQPSDVENPVEKCTCFNSVPFCTACKPDKNHAEQALAYSEVNVATDKLHSNKKNNKSPPGSTYTEVNDGTDKLQTINKVNILIDKKPKKNPVSINNAKRNKAEQCTCDNVDECICGKRCQCTCDDKDQCICGKVDQYETEQCTCSNIDQCTCQEDEGDQNKCSPDYLSDLVSRIEQALLDRNSKKNNKARPMDRSTTYSPPQRDQFAACVPENISLVQCTTNKPLGIDKSTTYSPLADSTICTPDTCLSNRGTNKEKMKTSKQTYYDPPVEVDDCICDEPPEVKNTVKSKPQKDKETLSLQVSKDVKSIDMCFCLCGSKKNLEKNGKLGECSCNKKKKHHKKSCTCKCKQCLSSLTSTSSSNSTSNKPRKCHCLCKCGFCKKDHICCGKEQPKEPSTTNDGSEKPPQNHVHYQTISLNLPCNPEIPPLVLCQQTPQTQTQPQYWYVPCATGLPHMTRCLCYGPTQKNTHCAQNVWERSPY
ncbi:unnamed protein product [Psylliodes chrysocephalus]|uniref:Uncharacterized protein n=1 Tax=Psylliodes chrysocephalus TaxID=3402493 RepID=A0A9P0D3H7_9CUCU|nr:unnamed protein product [Psylliodes chrysocephala]